VISLSKEANMTDLLGHVMTLLQTPCLHAALLYFAGECAAPVISLSKEANMADLLGPVMRRADAEVVHRHVPWAMKKNKAFFRCAASLAHWASGCCCETLWRPSFGSWQLAVLEIMLCLGVLRINVLLF
jgi:hypothetical protein